MRAGNLFLIPDFDQWNPVTVSEVQKQQIAGHMPPAQVCSTPEELQRYLSMKVEARRKAQPDAFQDNWEDQMEDAEAAGRIMQKDRSAGERDFQRLLADHPDTGSLYLVRGRAYESLGLKDLAANNYRRALELLLEGDLFREGALRALARVAD
jgi:Flp pilus assembly protein TadD